MSKYSELLHTTFIRIFSRIKPDKKVWAFSSVDKMFFNYNSKYLFLYVKDNLPDITPIYVINDDEQRLILQKKYGKKYFVESKTKEGIKKILGAGVWFTSSGLPLYSFFLKRKYDVINLWHGIPLKRIVMMEGTYPKWKKLYFKKLFSDNYKYILTSSPQLIDIMAESFLVPEEKIKVWGQPRNDCMIKDISRDYILDTYFPKKNFKSCKQLVLYSPTYRENTSVKLFPFEDFDKADFDKFLEDNDIVIAIRTHINESNIADSFVSDRIFTLNNDKLDDVTEVLAGFDRLISDYSSIYIDYLIANKPLMFLPYDKEEYLATRGLNFDYNKVTPGDKPKSYGEFKEALISDDIYREYRNEVKKTFSTVTYPVSERICNEVLSEIKNDEGNKMSIKTKLIGIMNKNLFIKRKIISVYYFFKKLEYKRKYYNKYKVRNNYVFFESFGGAKATCSPRALYDQMMKDEKYDGYFKIWAVKEPEDFSDLNQADHTIVVKYGSKLFYRYLSQCKYWITNSRLPDEIIKHDEQVFVQCWHGTPFKRLGYDIHPLNGNIEAIKTTNEAYDRDARKYDIAISPSPFYTEKISSAFNYEKNCPNISVIEKGYPRNDSLFTYNEDDVDRLKELFGVAKDKKVILYAPTYRDDQVDTGNGYSYDLGINFDKMYEALKDDYVILFRTHYYISEAFDFDKYGDFIIDVSSYNEVNNLYIISDILITDYSSVFFDFENLNRPVIFYMYDYESYKNEARDFYFDLEELPGPVFFKEDELINFFKGNKNIEIDKSIYDEFNDKFNPHRKPCSKEILNEIFN